MKTFRQYLEEARVSEIIHHNPSSATLKAIARNNKYGSARFVIYKDGTTVAGDSEKFTHQDIAPSMGAWKIRGYVTHHNGNYFYRSMGPYDNKPVDHENFRRFEKHGIDNGNENN